MWDAVSMAHVEIRLLGRPVVLIDGQAVTPPKGAKAWGLLAYLAATRQAHPRAELAELLFSEAADPLGALRWNLAALRRLLGRPDALKGHTIRLDVSDATVDTRQLEDDPHATSRPCAAGILLSGMSFPDSPQFEMWLTGERARLLRLTTSLLRERALRALATDDHDRAVDSARTLITLDPLDEGHHALLIRAHTIGGDAQAAQAQYQHCRDVLRRELAVEPGPAVVAAAHLAAGLVDASRTPNRDAIDARMVVAWQSFLAGSVDHGIDLSRSVVTMADRADDVSLQIMTRLFFSATLSIAVRGWDESAWTTTEALYLAEQGDHAYEEATARGVLAGLDLMRADYRAATAHATLGAARCSDPGTQALNLTFLAAVQADVGQGAQAVDHARRAVMIAEASADPLRIAYATAYAGHALLLEGDCDGARGHVERAVEVLAPILVLLPWPLAMLAEIEARSGSLDVAADLAARAEALAATTDIAYQRGLALRATALVAAARGDHETAIDQLTLALGHARRTTGEGYAFHWPVAWILESLAQVSAPCDPAASRRWSAALLDHATPIGMHTFIERGERLFAAAAPH